MDLAGVIDGSRRVAVGLIFLGHPFRFRGGFHAKSVRNALQVGNDQCYVAIQGGTQHPFEVELDALHRPGGPLEWHGQGGMPCSVGIAFRHRLVLRSNGRLGGAARTASTLMRGGMPTRRPLGAGLCAIGALRVESCSLQGTSPPGETKHWKRPTRRASGWRRYSCQALS